MPTGRLSIVLVMTLVSAGCADSEPFEVLDAGEDDPSLSDTIYTLPDTPDTPDTPIPERKGAI